MSNKYGAIKEAVDGITFDSRREAARYAELCLLLYSGAIADLQIHVPFVLQPAFKRDGKTERAISYQADFTYTDCESGKKIAEDVKGGRATRTALFEVKRKLFLYKYPDIEFRIVE